MVSRRGEEVYRSETWHELGRQKQDICRKRPDLDWKIPLLLHRLSDSRDGGKKHETTTRPIAIVAEHGTQLVWSTVSSVPCELPPSLPA